MEIIFANKDTHKEFTYEMYNQFMHLNISEKPSEIGAQGLSGHFPKEDIEVSREHMKLSIHKYYRTVDQRYNVVSPHKGQNDQHQKIYNNKCWRGYGEKITLLPAGGNESQ